MRLDQEIPVQPEYETAEAYADYSRHLDMLERLRNIDAELDAMAEEDRRYTAEQVAFCDELIAQIDRIVAQH